MPKENNHILLLGDSLNILKKEQENSIDTVITDPPYGLSKHSQELIKTIFVHWMTDDDSYLPTNVKGFLNNSWDAFVPPPALWKEVYRVMKPGATLLCFAGTRTQDIMTMSLRLAGFEIKDTLLWLYGTGFPKSYNIAKGIDKKMGIKHPKNTKIRSEEHTSELQSHSFISYAVFCLKKKKKHKKKKKMRKKKKVTYPKERIQHKR